jgi:hypothetical protein
LQAQVQKQTNKTKTQSTSLKWNVKSRVKKDSFSQKKYPTKHHISAKITKTPQNNNQSQNQQELKDILLKIMYF